MNHILEESKYEDNNLFWWNYYMKSLWEILCSIDDRVFGVFEMNRVSDDRATDRVFRIEQSIRVSDDRATDRVFQK